jgi:hypothetical protein
VEETKGGGDDEGQCPQIQENCRSVTHHEKGSRGTPESSDPMPRSARLASESVHFMTCFRCAHTDEEEDHGGDDSEEEEERPKRRRANTARAKPAASKGGRRSSGHGVSDVS